MNEKDDFILEAILKATPYHDKDSILSVLYSLRNSSDLRVNLSVGSSVQTYE